MEDLKVQPGDFVTYYARARDVSKGRRSSEARSDIFFLEVKPFEEEFVAAQSMGGQGGGMQDPGLKGLAEAQKQIIVATWNLDARTRRARGAQSPQDIKAVSRAQSGLRERAEQLSAQTVRMADPRVRRRTGGPAPGEDPIGKAIEAMARAVTELDKFSTAGAMPHEMEALNQLLRADADNRRRQVSRSQQAGGGGGQNRAEADLSSLFDQELRKRQSTNYETPNSTEARQETKQQDPLDGIRELARRQDALNREQRDLERNHNQMDAEELKRQLERLTREQNELRQQAQQLAQQMQLQARSGNRGGQGQGQQGQASSGRTRSRRRKAGIVRRSVCAISSARCKRRDPMSGAARSAICSSSHGSLPTSSAASPANRVRRRRGRRETTPGAGWRVSRNGWQIVPSGCKRTSAAWPGAVRASPTNAGRPRTPLGNSSARMCPDGCGKLRKPCGRERGAKGNRKTWPDRWSASPSN
jgi:hypothetical protein